jgi:hypothetical protein
MPERLSRVDVREMNFYDRHLENLKRITERDTGVSEGCGIYY